MYEKVHNRWYNSFPPGKEWLALWIKSLFWFSSCVGISALQCLASVTDKWTVESASIWTENERGFQMGGGLGVKSYFKVHCLFVMAPSKGRVDGRVCRCAAAVLLSALSNIWFLFLEHYSRANSQTGAMVQRFEGLPLQFACSSCVCLCFLPQFEHTQVYRKLWMVCTCSCETKRFPEKIQNLSQPGIFFMPASLFHQNETLLLAKCKKIPYFLCFVSSSLHVPDFLSSLPLITDWLVWTICYRLFTILWSSPDSSQPLTHRFVFSWGGSSWLFTSSLTSLFD